MVLAVLATVLTGGVAQAEEPGGATTAVAPESTATARTSSPPELLATALQLDRQGASADALATFEALATTYPEAPESAEALYQAARLRQRRLGDLNGALVHYRELAARFPTSRWAAGVPARVRLLESALADGAQALREYEDIMARHTRAEASEAETAKALEALARRYPDFALVPRALLFVALARRHQHDAKGAEALYEEVRHRFPERVEAFEAGKALGEMRFEHSDFRGAIERWNAVFPVQSADQALTLHGLMERARGHVRRRRIATACTIYLALFVGGAVFAARSRHSARSPRPLLYTLRAATRELAVLLPSLVFFFWLAYPNTIVNYFLGSFIAAIVPLVVLHVACIESGRVHQRAAVWYAAGVTGAVLALTYVLLYAYDLAFILERPLRWVSA